MRKIMFAIVAIIAFGLVGTAMAVPPGKTVEFDGKGGGKVVFDGKSHAEKGKKCNDCHPKIFKMKKGAEAVTMKDINAGKFCGACHNGKDAFDAKAADSCKKCHHK
ncbi:MAG: cytochrome c3 family protein [Nitrospirae bacterium]|nr:cytochrome c3 family protein [Nitrospirota bacterium]